MRIYYATIKQRCHDRINHRIDQVNTLDSGFDQFDRTNFASPDHLGQRSRIEPGKLIHKTSLQPGRLLIPHRQQQCLRQARDYPLVSPLSSRLQGISKGCKRLLYLACRYHEWRHPANDTAVCPGACKQKSADFAAMSL